MCLRPRLRRAAIAELDSLLTVLQDIHLQEGQDARRLTTTQRPFTYDALSPSPSIQDFHGRWIWQTKVPNKVKIFAWLYFKDRLSTKANLFYKNVKEDAICSRCEHPMEDGHHTFFGCPLSRDTWNTIGFGHCQRPCNWTLLPGPQSCLQFYGAYGKLGTTRSSEVKDIWREK